ncbi:ABC transporter permease [Ruminococcus sp. OA3]|uniref:ABC transporter permease n=1 Tax=Ruminococcus sp. OA3 TaxID=2914164 RepID=UPI001F060FF1|nr:ABC transporter permease [Ruminococcus sp. OA3]MCH1984493.1 ABC transporter permease [Ruminococcus sp. OA3]
MKKNMKSALMKIAPLLALIILGIILAFMLPGKFLRGSNLMNILKQAGINCMISGGMLVVLITAGIDLSVGSNTVLGACFIGVLMQKFGITNPFVLMGAALLICTLMGFVNGTLLTRLNLPHPFVSTLGMKNVLLGFALLITDSTPIGFMNKGVDSTLFLGSATIGDFPVSFIVVIIVYAIFHVFLTRTALGRQIYCVGGNAEAARLSGIKSKNVLTFVYSLSGFMCGLAAIILVGRVTTANATAGTTYDTDAIAACIIGGASFTGGKGTIWGTMMGAILIATIRNGLNLFGTKNDIQYIVIGAVIILAVTIDVVRNQMEAKARRLAAK